MKTTNQPMAVNANLKKFANVALTAKQTSMIKGGTGSVPPTTSEVFEDIIDA